MADFFTKPLQGSLFRKFRAVVMGHEHINSLKEPMSAPLQERVGIPELRNVADRKKTDEIRRTRPSYADAVTGASR